MRAVFVLCLLCALGAACARDVDKSSAVRPLGLQLPELSDDEFRTIASQIYLNETGGRARYLTYWGDGEDFPSFGIGHFIWFPAGVDAPFDESFPAMFEFVVGRGSNGPPPPEWFSRLTSMDAPWPDKVTFDAALASAESIELREWLSNTRSSQARFIAHSFAARWQALEMAAQKKIPLTILLNDIMRSPEGLFAVLDYFNFKGLGKNPRERYNGSGWGLVQVLDGMLRTGCAETASISVLNCFSFSAASRLQERVVFSPPERNEERWLEGWLRRVADYVPSRDGFAMAPYLQKPVDDSMTVVWFSKRKVSGRLAVRLSEAGLESDQRHFQSQATVAPGLYYHTVELESFGRQKPRAAVYQHAVVINDLLPGHEYEYEAYQGVEEAGGRFRAPASRSDPIRFMVYGDSEAEPESTGEYTLWPGVDPATAARRYVVDQTAGYAANLEVIESRRPDFVAIAGDLVESGGEQRDWDEFWRHNKRLAARTPILPALGNHEYYGGPELLGGYSDAASQRAIAKYRRYFSLPTANIDTLLPKERFYSLRYGVISLIVLDTNNGVVHQSANDTNWRLQADGLTAAWDDASGQAAWLQRELARAQRHSAYTFVMFHQAPYSSGVHNQPPGLEVGKDYLSGVPLRQLTPLFLRYGVDAVFNGHDEVYEHSIVQGFELTPEGIDAPHELHYLVVGIGGDGLRGSFDGVQNPLQVFSAHTDATEVYNDAGNLVAGGKHYGHLEVNVMRDARGCWISTLEPVYVFPVLVSPDEPPQFERRVYDDVTMLKRCASNVAEPINSNMTDH